MLVTGGAGFIGSHVVDRLLSQSMQVVAIDNLTLGKEDNISQHFSNKDFKFIKENVNNTVKLNDLFESEKFDCIFHLAANSDISQSFQSPEIDLNNTFNTTYSILNAMKLYEVRKLVFASTSAIYGDTIQPLSEDFGPLIPVSHYGASKLASEAFIYSFCENYGIQTWVVRFPNVIGERATHGIIFDFINKLRSNPHLLEVLGDGNQYKPYLYIKDLVDAIFFIFENAAEQINIYNVGVETRTRVSQIAKDVINAMGLDAEIKYTGGERGWIGDVPEFNYKLEKLHKLGFKARMTSDEAVKLSVKKILEQYK